MSTGFGGFRSIKKSQKAAAKPEPSNEFGTATPSAARNPLYELLTKLQSQEPTDDRYNEIWELWEKLSEEEQQKLCMDAKMHNLSAPNDPTTSPEMKVLKCKMVSSDTVQQVKENDEEYDLDLSEDESEEDIPESAAKFADAFRSAIQYMNPDLSRAQIDLALVAMSTQSGKWNEIISQFPERQLALHNSLLRRGPAALQPKV